MSSDRSNPRPLKPTLASNRTIRSPLTPRLGSSATPPINVRPTLPRVAARTPVLSPRINAQDEVNLRDSVGSNNITPRSSARKLRVEGVQVSPAQEDGANGGRPRTVITLQGAPVEKGGQTGGLSVTGGSHNLPRVSRPASALNDSGSGKLSPMLPRSTGYLESKHYSFEVGTDDHFFHASDLQKQEPVPKRPEPRKAPAFFYADGKEDRSPSPQALSPVLSAVTEEPVLGPKMRLENNLNSIATSSPSMSPALSSLAAASPYFSGMHVSHNQKRASSPSKENIHLSYRKGASQIFGVRPTVQSVASLVSDNHTTKPIATHMTNGQLRPGLTPGHRKSSSVSSIDSGNSYQARQRSATAIDVVSTTTPEVEEPAPTSASRSNILSLPLPTIDTSLVDPTISHPVPERAPSPTKAVAELAAEARRERKVLDLEISNSSLLAINASLEREVRRQKAELKRFRRLSRSGRFSFAPDERSARFSEGLSAVGEDHADDDDDTNMDDSFTGFTEDYSDSDSGSFTSGSDPRSPDVEHPRNQERLAKDEKRLRVDLAKHKELLVQSQMMNQSLKRCMYATEEMIKEGKKALQYHVRVSDVKLGGRVLTGMEDEDEPVEIDVQKAADDETFSRVQESMESANALLDVWKGVGRPSEGSEASGDRDSGIEVDKPVSRIPLPHGRPEFMRQTDQAQYAEDRMTLGFEHG